jgi:hydrogenase maturation protease
MTKAQPHISVLVLGIGNLVMGDDGVGVLVAQRLQREYRFADNVEIMDGGTLGLDLLPKLENITNLIMIDAVETGQKSGTCVRLCGRELPIAL